MKHWKISYSVKRMGEIKEKDLILEAANIDDALAKAHKAVATMELPNSKAGDMFSIWDVGIMEDEVL
jgi:hypothetical protein